MSIFGAVLAFFVSFFSFLGFLLIHYLREEAKKEVEKTSKEVEGAGAPAPAAAQPVTIIIRSIPQINEQDLMILVGKVGVGTGIISARLRQTNVEGFPGTETTYSLDPKEGLRALAILHDLLQNSGILKDRVKGVNE